MADLAGWEFDYVRFLAHRKSRPRRAIGAILALPRWVSCKKEQKRTFVID
jgi:hypothetical protein